MRKKASLDSYLNQAGTDKTASNSVPSSDTQEEIISKLASFNEELNKSAADNKPGEGTVAENSDTVAEPSAEVKSQTDNVIDDQLAIDAPGAKEEQEAGDKPVTIVGAKPVVSTTGTGGVAKPSADVSIEPESAAAAKQPTDKTATDISDPVQFGKIAAHSMSEELKKIAKAEEALDAAIFLKSANLLQGYDIEGLEKTASISPEEVANNVFEKMASNPPLPLTNDEIICAAQVYGDALEKEAEAERQLELDTLATEQLEKEAEAKEAKSNEALAKFSGDQEVMNAVAVLQRVGLVKSE